MFLSDKFYFNGIHCDEKNIILANMDSNILNKYGLGYNKGISLNKLTNDLSYFNDNQEVIDEVVLQMFLTDGMDSPQVWEDNVLQDILNWLITDDFRPFISEDNLDLTYYFKVVGIDKFFDHRKRGYLEVRFQPYSNFAYRQFNKTFIVETSKELPFYNYSNIQDKYFPIMEITNNGDENTIFTVQNTTVSNDSLFTITGLKKGEKVIIDNLLGTVKNENNENLISKCNRKWLKMYKFNNKIKFEGNGKISIKAQFPIRV